MKFMQTAVSFRDDISYRRTAGTGGWCNRFCSVLVLLVFFFHSSSVPINEDLHGILTSFLRSIECFLSNTCCNAIMNFRRTQFRCLWGQQKDQQEEQDLQPPPEQQNHSRLQQGGLLQAQDLPAPTG